MAKKVEAEKKFIFTSKNIDEITEKIKNLNFGCGK